MLLLKARLLNRNKKACSDQGTVTVRHGHFRIARGYDPSVRVPDVMLESVGFVGEVMHRDADDAVDGS